jgi:uncharacterized protein
MHKPMCTLVNLLVVVGGLNWGLVGIGGFMGKDLNVVHMLLGAWPMVENIVYVLVGLAAIVKAVMFFTKCKECPCNAK